MLDFSLDFYYPQANLLHIFAPEILFVFS